MLMLLTATLCHLCCPRWYHHLMSYTYTLCSSKYSWGICYSAENSRLILHSGSRLNCISPRCCAISAFVFLSPPLDSGWFEVVWRELCSFVLLMPFSSSPLPSIVLTDVDWVPAGALLVYFWRLCSAIKILLCIFLCGNLLVEANLRLAAVSDGGTHL